MVAYFILERKAIYPSVCINPWNVGSILEIKEVTATHLGEWKLYFAHKKYLKQFPKKY